MKVEIITTVTELSEVVRGLRKSGRTIGVVPTMGALHEGHLSLARASLADNDDTIVTIFLNPTQFAPQEDLSRYPRTLESDVERLAAEGVGYVFAPPREEVYPDDFTTSVVAPAVGRRLEGEFRPTHFGGVVTVVLKILNMTCADRAYFGQKDYQQAMVIRQMVRDLNVPTEISVCPIVRDQDGLALSSRNVFLSPEQRTIALSLNTTLLHVEAQIKSGQRDGFEVVTEMRQMLIDSGVERIDYAIIAHPDSLEMADPIVLPAVALIAAYVGETRLLDNRVFSEG
ncbi:pantoate--beta-alanine ligase [Mariniblastus sp.]|mgnify:FL=1|nr:pantoate--beta-alanine ligase [Mariniblastus sp.]MDA7887323.1 pantoate--beta-alanine ligase [bacterium]MDA7903273.1 pantoate--beta-alanine ligase [Mariniblastus sp.]MDA7905555.1 pantoate--beta-alanine ligase [Mariniblastus sp.]MDB4368611.1 pantoate--beta-alanine ligase [bacterium]